MKKQEIINSLIEILEERAKTLNVDFANNSSLSFWQVKRLLTALSVELLQNIYQDGNPLTGFSSNGVISNIVIYSRKSKKGHRLAFTLTDNGVIIEVIEDTLVFAYFGCIFGTSVKDIDFDEFIFSSRIGIKNFLE